MTCASACCDPDMIHIVKKPCMKHCSQFLLCVSLHWCPMQLGGVHADGETADMNVSAVALAAVDIAATALDSALLSVERTVERSQQHPEVIVAKQPDEGLQQACLSWQLQPCASADPNQARHAVLGILSTLCGTEHLCV